MLLNFEETISRLNGSTQMSKEVNIGNSEHCEAGDWCLVVL